MGNQNSAASSIRDSPGAQNSNVVSNSTESPVTSSPWYDKSILYPSEKVRYGFVRVKISSMIYTNRRQSEQETHVVVTPRGCIFYGSQTSPAPLQRAIASSSTPILPPAEIAINDSKAHRLMVIHCNDGWHLIPSQDPFSRHSGTCLILGDKKGVCPPYQIKLGDCFRLGSVGIVVSEMKTESGDEERLDANMLQFLKDEALAFDQLDDMATLAAEEELIYRRSLASEPLKDAEIYESSPPESPAMRQEKKASQNIGGGIANGERFVCYMCYETHDTASDPLIAPCDCKGDTRYLHVQCLQKWYYSTSAGPQARVIRTTGNGAPACKICGVAYKTTIKKPDGKRGSILEVDSRGPYISFVVVTRHDTNPGLFNTKFRLNFGRLNNEPLVESLVGPPTALTIGRSSTCNLVLDYRTVSTSHAIVGYENNVFTIQDKNSSNGTMVYVKNPIHLKYANSVRFRMGRTTLQLLPKRNIQAAFRHAISSTFTFSGSTATPFISSSASVVSNATLDTSFDDNHDGEVVKDKASRASTASKSPSYLGALLGRGRTSLNSGNRLLSADDFQELMISTSSTNGTSTSAAIGHSVVDMGNQSNTPIVGNLSVSNTPNMALSYPEGDIEEKLRSSDTGAAFSAFNVVSNTSKEKRHSDVKSRNTLTILARRDRIREDLNSSELLDEYDDTQFETDNTSKPQKGPFPMGTLKIQSADESHNFSDDANYCMSPLGGPGTPYSDVNYASTSIVVCGTSQIDPLVLDAKVVSSAAPGADKDFIFTGRSSTPPHVDAKKNSDFTDGAMNSSSSGSLAPSGYLSPQIVINNDNTLADAAVVDIDFELNRSRGRCDFDMNSPAASSFGSPKLSNGESNF